MQKSNGSDAEQRLKEYFARTRRSYFLERFEWAHLLICSGIIGFFILLLVSGALTRVENIFFDAALRYRPVLKTDPRIVIIEIEEESIKAIGRWPWPWHYHAQMINLLAEWGARAVVFDMIFKDPKVPYESRVIEDAFRDKKPFYLPVLLEPKPEKKIWVHSLPIVLEREGQRKEWAHSIPDIEKFAAAFGHSNLSPDPDGVLRRVKPYLEYNGEGYFYLPLKAAYDFLGENLSPGKGPPGVPLDADGNFLINWAGRWKETFIHYPYEELIRSYHTLQQGGRPVVGPENIRGKICIIGLTAAEFENVLVNPFESAYFSVGVEANCINSVLTGRWIVPVPAGVHILCLLGIGILASLLFATFRNVPSFIAGLALGGLWTGVSFGVFLWKGIWLFVFHPLLLILVLFIFSAIYGQIVAGKEHSRLFDLATRDGLTGVFVIRHFREILNQVVEEARARGEPLSLLLIDIDNFKSINDQHGHPAGDMVLKKVAQLIRGCLRSDRPIHETDFVARYGGEEFIVLLRNVQLDIAATKIAERIRAVIEQAVFEWKNIFIPVRISLGAATLHGNENFPDPMVHRADEALYQAKKTGKNKVCTEKADAG